MIPGKSSQAIDWLLREKKDSAFGWKVLRQELVSDRGPSSKRRILVERFGGE